MNCLNSKSSREHSHLTNKQDHQADDDVDLETLITYVPSDDEEEENDHQQSDSLNHSGTSDESCTSLDNGSVQEWVNEKIQSNGRRFLKSLPISILNRRRIFGSHSDISSNSRPSSPVIHQFSSSIPNSGTDCGLKSLNERSRKKRNGSNQITWSVWIPDAPSPNYQDIDLPQDATCSLLLHMLLLKLQRPADLTCWSIMLRNGELLLERIVEDHEVLSDIKDTWSHDSINQLFLCKTPSKYEILQSPDVCLPQGMLTMPAKPLIFETKESKRYKMQNVLTKTAAEFSGWLHTRDSSTHYWKKVFCVLRNSGFYLSTKNESKDSRCLQAFADVLSSNVWSSLQSKKTDATSFRFCIKVKNSNELKWLNADSQHEQKAWINAIRLIINGNRFYESYINARRQKVTAIPNLQSSTVLSSSENNLVAMDFSGTMGRIISDPSEVAMMELEQQTSWRKKFIRSTGHLSLFSTDYNGSAPSRQAAWISRSIHNSQTWFFGKISREDAAECLHRQGLIEGSYLVRDSHRIPGGYVITLCHNQKIKHIPVSQMEIEGQLCFSLDNGDTRFADLIQLVDFHRLNRGTLPCKLQHEVTMQYT